MIKLLSFYISKGFCIISIQSINHNFIKPQNRCQINGCIGNTLIDRLMMEQFQPPYIIKHVLMLLFQSHPYWLSSLCIIPFSIVDLIVDEYYIGKARLTVINNNKLVNKRKISRLKQVALCPWALNFHFSSIVGAMVGLSALIRIFSYHLFVVIMT